MENRLLELISFGEEETIEIAKGLATGLGPGDVVLLCGELGAGKTRFAKGLILGLGVVEEAITSPTFTLLNIYEGKITVYHMDFYRLGDSKEVFGAGLDPRNYGDGVVIVEWGDKFNEILSQGVFHVKMEIIDEERRAIKILFPERDDLEKLYNGIKRWKKEN